MKQFYSHFFVQLTIMLFGLFPVNLFAANLSKADSILYQRLEKNGSVIHNLNEIQTNGSYFIENVATGKFLKGGGDWGLHLAIADVGIPMNIISNENHYRISAGIANCYINVSGVLDGASGNAVEMTISSVSDGVFLITGVNNRFMSANEETGLVNFDGRSTIDAHAHWWIWDIDMNKFIRRMLMPMATQDIPIDATVLIPGANIDNEKLPGNKKWTKVVNGTKMVDGIQGVNSEPIMEVYRANGVTGNFSISQTINLLPGVYKLQVQGFYRDGFYDTAAERRVNGSETICAYLFAGDSKIPLNSIFSENRQTASLGFSTRTQAGYVPNTFTHAGFTFQEGAYENELIFTVEKGKENVKLGIKGDASSTAGNWTVFDNFRLTYYGTQNIESGGTYYLQNVAKQQYLYCGSYWSTHVMVSEKALDIQPVLSGGRWRLLTGFFTDSEWQNDASTPGGSIGQEGYVDNTIDVYHHNT